MTKLWKEVPQGSWFLEKKKEKGEDVDNLFVGATLCVEVSKSCDKVYFEEWLGDSGA